MFKQLFGKKETTRLDVFMALVGVTVAAWKAFDTYKEYKNKEISA